MNDNPVQLWSDEPASTDLLAFGAVAETTVEAVLDDTLDPIALGISGPWGSGKSTVLKLIKAELESRDAVGENDAIPDERILVVETDPWRYDPDVGAKGTLILEVLNALTTELEARDGVRGAAGGALKKLTMRVNWVKALKLAARTSITLQLPGIDDLTSLVSEGDLDGTSEPRNLDEFRHDFAELLEDEHLSHLRRVVVLVDDLDRCLPDTVVDTLETMRLFLSVPKMCFVIAADEDRVADALRDRYPAADGSAGKTEAPPASLNKIVRRPSLPASKPFDRKRICCCSSSSGGRRRIWTRLTSSSSWRAARNCASLVGRWIRSRFRRASTSLRRCSLPLGSHRFSTRSCWVVRAE